MPIMPYLYDMAKTNIPFILNYDPDTDIQLVKISFWYLKPKSFYSKKTNFVTEKSAHRGIILPNLYHGGLTSQ